MSPDTRSSPLAAPGSEVIGEPIGDPIGEDLPPVVPNTARAREAAAAREAADAPAATSTGRGGARGKRPETRGEHFRRMALRVRLNGYAIAGVVLVALLIALAASNTAQVKVHWLIGTSHVSLVWLVLVGAVVGWLLGLLSGARFHWRTRAPRA